MERKGGTVFLLLVSCTVLATSIKDKGNTKITEVTRQLMKECKATGDQQNDMEGLADIDVSVEETSPNGQRSSLSSPCMNVIKSVFDGTTASTILSSLGEKLSSSFSITTLAKMIQKMQEISGDSKCIIGACFAPLSWEAVNTAAEDIDTEEEEEEFKLLVLGAEPMMKILPKRLKLSKSINWENMKILMKMLRKWYHVMQREQRKQIMEWVKEKAIQKCKSEASPDSGRCDNWVTSPALYMLGPYISSLSETDITLSPQEDLCGFFKSDQFESVIGKIDSFNPSLGNKLFNKVKNCSGFQRYLDRLGPLACYYRDSGKLTQSQRVTLLAEISQCPAKTQLAKRLMTTITGKNMPEMIKKLGKAAELLSSNDLELITDKDDVLDVLNNPKVTLRKRQKRRLLQKLSSEDLGKLKTVEGLPNKVLKRVIENKKEEILRDPEVLRNMSKNIDLSQAMTAVTVLRRELNATKLLDLLPDNFLPAVPLKTIQNATSIPWDKIKETDLRIGQALALLKNETGKSRWFKNLKSLILGVTCKMIEDINATDVLEMSEDLADGSRWLSKHLAGCVAQKLFTTLASQRPNYFQTMTAEELSRIPIVFFVHLSPEKVMDLPDTLCSDFLDKMKTADLRKLARLSPSRPALLNKSLECLDTGLSSMSTEDLLMLGPLTCQLSPTQVRELELEVRKTALQALVSCDYIPKNHQKGIAQLVTDTFGDSLTWTPSTMEEFISLLLLDENAEPSLPVEPWMKDLIVFRFLHGEKNDFLEKHLFNITVGSTEPVKEPARRKRAASSNGNGNNKPGDSSNSTSSTNSTAGPTVELITELGRLNDKWMPLQLENMTLETFKATVEILGSVTTYSSQQLNVLKEKAVEAWGSAGSMNESVVDDLGCIIEGFSSEKLKNMAISQSSLSDIASCGWTQSQLSAVWKGAAKYNDLSAESLDASDLADIDVFICGPSSAEIQQLNPTAFADAVALINKVGCSAEVAQHFKPIIVEAFGPPSSWDKDVVSDLGTFIVVLNADELASMNKSVFSYISPEAIPLIPPEHFANVSAAQLQALGADNAARLTEAQKQALTPEQQSGLNQAMAGSRDETPQNNNSGGSSSNGAEHMGSFTKTLMFFLVGLILLSN